MKHNRSAAYDRALAGSSDGLSRWSEITDDPNDPCALAFRARTLRAAWREPIEDRINFILDRCRGRRVLDIGCVAHDVARMASPDWLHRRVAEVAATCLGVDVLEEGVEHLNRVGFHVLAHDLTTGPGPVGEAGPFDVIVAGELIEHVPALDMLFTSARDLLTADGELIITTPNPWAPHRVAAGQRGDCWENADHILFAFPSGIAELAERHGLVLAEATTTTPDSSSVRTPRQLAKAVRRRVRGTGWVRVAFATQGPEGVVRVPRRPTLKPARGARPATFVGETFVYVVKRTAAAG
ncbi:class I SAM-dependent methyltransferase [Knoellia sp. Soil729]|uniref:class I SAM-dependent methyltransferase n=1 Tax=Knoellia sp. Soil729 TaxID=1736394 RepID=UPI0006F60BD0|nr:class I SAM-dependent methyltransferase [Knoellia sp. Soil729]KRE43461.1 hypothetical protein ASG74_00995 [Knoellia sp. Soil729]